jgi:hypothetical protein
MKTSIIYRSLLILICSFLCTMPALTQFMQGTLISIDTNGINENYDLKEQLKLGELTIDYKQVGKFNIEGGSKVFIARSGGFMQNFEYTQGNVMIVEQIIIGDSVIPRKISYEDGISTVKVSPTKYSLKQGIYIDLNNLWIEIRQERTIPELVSQMNSRDPMIRLDAVEVLATYGKSASSPLLKALNDSAFYIREYSTVAVGKLKDVRAVKPLISLLNDEVWYIRWRAAWALGQIKGTEQIVPLTQSLKKEEVEFVRNTITKSLKKLNSLK